jgi:hypothetical protein
MARRLGSARTVNADSMERIYRTRYILVNANAIVGTVMARIDDALIRLVTRENSSYTQIWNSLARQQKIALKAVIEEGGTDLRSAAVLAR